MEIKETCEDLNIQSQHKIKQYIPKILKRNVKTNVDWHKRLVLGNLFCQR